MALNEQQRYLLSRLADEELSPEESTRAGKLLEQDPSAQAYFAELTAMKCAVIRHAATMKAAPHKHAPGNNGHRAPRRARQVTPSRVNTIREGRRRKRTDSDALPRRTSSPPAWGIATAAAAAILVGLLAVYWASQTGTTSRQKPRVSKKTERTPSRIKKTESPATPTRPSPELVEPAPRTAPEEPRIKPPTKTPKVVTPPPTQNAVQDPPAPTRIAPEPRRKTPEPEPKQPTPPAEPKKTVTPSSLASLEKLNGNASLSRAGQTIALKPETDLRPGDALRTESNASLLLACADGRKIELAPESMLSIGDEFELRKGAVRLFGTGKKTISLKGLALPRLHQRLQVKPGETDAHIFVSPARQDGSRKVASLTMHVWSGDISVVDGSQTTTIRPRQSIYRVCSVSTGKDTNAAIKTLTVDWKPMSAERRPITVRWGPGKSYVSRCWASFLFSPPGDRWVVSDLAEQMKSLHAKPVLGSSHVASLRKRGLFDEACNVSTLLSFKPTVQVHNAEGGLIASGAPKAVLEKVPADLRQRVARGLAMLCAKKGKKTPKMVLPPMRVIHLNQTFLSQIVGTPVHIHPKWSGKSLGLKHKVRMTPDSLFMNLSKALGARITHDTSGYHISPAK